MKTRMIVDFESDALTPLVATAEGRELIKATGNLLMTFIVCPHDAFMKDDVSEHEMSVKNKALVAANERLNTMGINVSKVEGIPD
jgi:hypothetical protein